MDSDGISLVDYSDVVARLDFEKGTVDLPVDAIRSDSPEVTELRNEARQALVDSCLRESGLSGIAWPPSPPQGDDRLYGLWSVTQAARYGFGVAGDSGKPDRSDEQSRCIQSARAEMEELGRAADTYSLDKKIVDNAYDAVQVSPEGKAAVAAAQACMRSAGLTLDPESGFPQADGSPSNSETNIRIAVAEATCMVETGAIQTLYDLTAKYQAALIDRNEAAVVELARERDELIAGYQAIIDANR